MKLILMIGGVACLGISAFLVVKLRQGVADGRWSNDSDRETGLALTQFILMALGLALIAKGVF